MPSPSEDPNFKLIKLEILSYILYTYVYIYRNLLEVYIYMVIPSYN